MRFIDYCQHSIGGTFTQMRLRLFGSLLGAMYSYFAFIAIGNSIPLSANWILFISKFPTSQPTTHVESPTLSPVLSLMPTVNSPTRSPANISQFFSLQFDNNQVYNQMAIFVPLIFICGIIKQNKSWSYFGSITSTTAQIVSFGVTPLFNYPDYGNELLVAYVILLRIQENAVGLCLVMVLTLLTFPPLASDLLKNNMIEFTGNLSSATLKVWSILHSTAEVETKQNQKMSHKEELQYLENVRVPTSQLFTLAELPFLTSKIVEQHELVTQSVMEKMFALKPFDDKNYNRIVHCEETLVSLLYSLDIISNRLSKVSHLEIAKPAMKFTRRIRRDYALLMKEIYYGFKGNSCLLESSMTNKNYSELKFYFPNLKSTASPVVIANEKTANEKTAAVYSVDPTASAIIDSDCNDELIDLPMIFRS